MTEPTRSESRLTRAAINHPVRVIAIWLLVLAASVLLIATQLGDGLVTDQETTNDPDSMRALELMDAHLPDRVSVHETVVIASSRHEVGSAAFDAFLAPLLQQAPDIGVELAGGGGDAQSALQPPTSADGHALLLPLAYATSDRTAAAERLVAAVQQADEHPDFEVNVTGQTTLETDLNELSARDLKEGELYVGLPVAMLVLLLVFGTIIGALLPLVVAVVAIIGALALAALIGMQWPLSLFVVNMISGMGLALGIDYSLFVLSRYREERAHGADRDAAIRITGLTASRAVLFSGLTFVVALTGMLLIPTTIMRSLAIGAILVGIVAVAAALTLLPALLRLLGDRVDSLRLPIIGRWSVAVQDGRRGFWPWLVRHVMRRPIVWGGTVTALLLAAAVPALQMDTGAAGVATFPEDLPSRQGYEAIARHFPDEAFQPARIVVHDADGLDAAWLQAGHEALTSAVEQRPGFGTPTLVASEDDTTALITLPVGADSLAVEAVDRVRSLRATILPEAFDLDEQRGAQVLVTGNTALNIDYFDVMSDWLVPVVVFVLGLSFLLLLAVFRSVPVPIVAIVLNLLSVGATYGLLVLVFQHGFGADLLGLRQVDTTEAWVPLFLFSVLFGLSMDYHMFLMTRIRERWVHDGDTADAVVWGVGSTGRIITGAALIIVAVFLGFAVGDLVMFQQMGFGVGVALLIDATLVRGVLLPSAMALLGERNWYLPRWLRWLPEIQAEGPPPAR